MDAGEGFRRLAQHEVLKLTLLVQGGLTVAAFAAGWFLNVPFWHRLDYTIEAFVYGFGVSGLMFLAALMTLKVKSRLTRRIQKDAEMVMTMLGSLSVSSIFFVSLAAGISEEMLFRGFLQPWLQQWIGDVWAIVAASIIFGLLHLVSISYMIYVSLFGVIFGLLYYWSGNLLIPIVAHFAYDFLLLTWGIHARRRRGFSG